MQRAENGGTPVIEFANYRHRTRLVVLWTTSPTDLVGDDGVGLALAEMPVDLINRRTERSPHTHHSFT